MTDNEQTNAEPISGGASAAKFQFSMRSVFAAMVLFALVFAGFKAIGMTWFAGLLICTALAGSIGAAVSFVWVLKRSLDIPPRDDA